MSRADLLLFRRMRGIFWGLLVVGMLVLPVLLVLGITIPAHLDLLPAEFVRDNGEPAKVFLSGFSLALFVGSIAAVVLGATAGSIDHQRGVLRDLVVAGLPRWRIVLGRLLAAIAWLVVALAGSFAAVLALSALLAPLDVGIDWDEVRRQTLQAAPSLAYTVPFAAGVALLIGSRGPAIAVFFVVALVIDNVLTVIPEVGDWWTHVSLNQADQQVRTAILADSGLGPSSDRPLWGAVLVLAAWAVLPLVAGIVRLGRRDL